MATVSAPRRFTIKFRRRALVALAVVVSAALILASSYWDLASFPPPPGTADYVSSYFLGYLGLWEVAMSRVRRARSAIFLSSSARLARSGVGDDSEQAEDEDDEDRLAAVYRRIATLHERMGQFDEAAEVMEREVLPRLRQRFVGTRGSAVPGAAGTSLTRAQVWELAMTDLSELHRKRGMFREGLGVLAEAQEQYEAALSSLWVKPDGQSKDRKNGSRPSVTDALASLTQSTLQKEHDVQGEEMRELAADLERSGEYVAMVEEMARRYEFSTRRKWTLAEDRLEGNEGKDEDRGGGKGRERGRGEGDTCPTDASSLRSTLYAPSNSLFGTVVVLLLIGPVRTSWFRLFHPPPPTKLSRVRRVLGLANSLFSVVAVCLYWNWSLQIDAARYNSMGKMLYRLGKHDTALVAFDASRCSVLSNPREETVLRTEVAAETFAGAAYVLEGTTVVGGGGSSGSHSGGKTASATRELVDDLIGDVDDLLGAASALPRPSFYVASHYLRVSDLYFGRVVLGQGEGKGEGDGDESRNVADKSTKEAELLWRKEGRRYRSLAEAETRRLARYIEEMMEEEVERMSKERRGQPGGRNKTLPSLEGNNADEEEEQEEEITVRIDR
uniref:Uncharacterized protein n=1 Tax=Odontella aurita TaxID=265563 RepID=A0A7S4ND96_9STRA|mmetsp:Transcript_58022/g.173170  ORF Transcript_58022/g.173170 Transcript_58022/m.173170 type:complete len:614 (+) Transcript_58022:191-2032(+)